MQPVIRKTLEYQLQLDEGQCKGLELLIAKVKACFLWRQDTIHNIFSWLCQALHARTLQSWPMRPDLFMVKLWPRSAARHLEKDNASSWPIQRIGGYRFLSGSWERQSLHFTMADVALGQNFRCSEFFVLFMFSSRSLLEPIARLQVARSSHYFLVIHQFRPIFPIF